MVEVPPAIMPPHEARNFCRPGQVAFALFGLVPVARSSRMDGDTISLSIVFQGETRRPAELLLARVRALVIVQDAELEAR